jgi:hypothetical protein
MMEPMLVLAAAYAIAASHIDMEHMDALRPDARRLLKKADRLIGQLSEFQRWQVEELHWGRKPSVSRFVWSEMGEVLAATADWPAAPTAKGEG